MDKEAEQQSIRRVLDGEADAFSLLVDRYKNRIFSAAYRITRHPADAEDLAQEVFLRAYKRLDAYDQNQPFFPWLYGILMNVAIDHLKKQRSRQAESWSNMESGRHSVVRDQDDRDQDLVRWENGHTLVRHLSQLPPKQIKVIMLRFFRDMSFEDIAAELGITVSDAKMTTYRGLNKLRVLLTVAGEHR